jgi:hypothetical protein
MFLDIVCYELHVFVSITSTCVLNYHLILARAQLHIYVRYLKVARAEPDVILILLLSFICS